MSQLNVDADIARRHSVSNVQAKMVQLQNGCICCTLREDLLVEVCSLLDVILQDLMTLSDFFHFCDFPAIISLALHQVRRLAEAGRFDYLIIESSGISEPLPVAETFTFELDDEDDDESDGQESEMKKAKVRSLI